MNKVEINKKCVPCTAATPVLKGEELKKLVQQLGGQWKVVEEKRLEREYRFNNFREALEFTNAIGAIAEEQGHHPDILLGWGKVKISLWTHKIGGLSESDFVLAAKCDVAFVSRGR